MEAIYNVLCFDWMDGRSFLVFMCVFLLVADVWKNRKPPNFPPGPWPLPFIGDFHRLDFTRLHLQMVEFSKKYGKVFTVHVLGGRMVVITGYKLVREALRQKGEDFDARPHIPVVERLFEKKGVSTSAGNVWKQQKRFALRTLKKFGVGKKTLETSIHLECRYLNEAIALQQGKPFDVYPVLNNAVSNIICCLVFGKRFEYTDEEYQSIIHGINELVDLVAGFGAQVYNLSPGLMNWLPGPHQKILILKKFLLDIIEMKIQQHRDSFDPSSLRDYIDCFLAEMEENNDEDSGFDFQNLTFLTLDLIVGGSETSTTTLHWGLLYMITNPHIQERVQAEIDTVVGPSRQPSLTDRDNMPYTNAVIHEIQRMANVIPLNFLHMTSKDTTLDKYSIPKGTVILPVLTSVLFDESMWETPHSFNPQHFLDQNGKFRQREAFLPFSTGKRVCPGEQLAKMELFLIFTSLLQSLSFSTPAGDQPSLGFKLGATLNPIPYRLCAVPR